MKKPTPTRTIGPVHFEDLEPHRFEDLVRQLAYDFRPWRRLEPTGRSGSDDGFDARGTEGDGEATDAADDGDEDEASTEEPPNTPERVWLIQCKREKIIGPKKLGEYLGGIPSEERGRLYGIIFAAACEFSKIARDTFRSKARELGVSEAYLWGKGDIEDMLFQPKNDHLLFAYFGISLQMRRRSLQTDVRARLATKRKVIRVLSKANHVLIRNASDDRYPYRDFSIKGDRLDQGQWLVAQFDRWRHDGLHFLRRHHLAFIHDDGIAWDFADRTNDADPRFDPWRTEKEQKEHAKRYEIRQEAHAVWEELPEQNRAIFQVWGILPFESILAIDDDGDDWFQDPHIYTVPFTRTVNLFRDRTRVVLRTIRATDLQCAEADPEKRVKIFPREGDPPLPRKTEGMTID